MNVSPDGIDFTQSFEGCSLTPYQDEAGVWTQGYGETGDDIGPDSPPWTQEEATEYFMQRAKAYEDAVNADVTVPLEQYQFDALFDFAYNLGNSALAHSTLIQHINSGGDLTGLFELWDKVRENGELVVSAGLLRRRKAEDALFTSGDYGITAP
jgi:lysozyme